MNIEATAELILLFCQLMVLSDCTHLLLLPYTVAHRLIKKLSSEPFGAKSLVPCLALPDNSTHLNSSLSPNARTMSGNSSITALAARFIRSSALTSFGFSKS